MFLVLLIVRMSHSVGTEDRSGNSEEYAAMPWQERRGFVDELLSEGDISIPDFPEQREPSERGRESSLQSRRSESPIRVAPRRGDRQAARAKPKGKAKGAPKRRGGPRAFGPKSRQWTFTLNNYEPEDVRGLQDAVNDNKNRIEYLIFQPEVGAEGTPHLQGYITFLNRRAMSTVKRLIGRTSHLEVVRGSPIQNKNYCSDPNKRDPEALFGVFEWGELPMSHNLVGKSAKLVEVKSRLDEGTITTRLPQRGTFVDSSARRTLF
jgi:hypothetical protein